MCVIAICQDRHLTLNEIQSMTYFNSDGIGIAYINKNSVRIVKGFSDSTEFFYFIDTHKPVFPYLVHFRLGTHGMINAPMCHPFYVGFHRQLNDKWYIKHNCNIAIAHNGILHFDKIKTQVVSDTYVLVRDYLTELNYDSILSILADTTSNKFAILTLDGFKLYGKFTYLDGIIVSNTTWNFDSEYEEEDWLSEYSKLYNTSRRKLSSIDFPFSDNS